MNDEIYRHSKKNDRNKYCSMFNEIFEEGKSNIRSEEFEKIIFEVGEAFNWDPREIPPALWGIDNWDYMEQSAREIFLGNLLVTQLERIAATPVYEAINSPLLKMNPKEFRGLGAAEILKKLPILRKDSAKGDGFRYKANRNENIMKPNIPGVDDSQWSKWYSGGTKGDPTPTFLAERDLEAEAFALARGFRQGGFKKGDKIFTTYNLSHKGGRLIVDASRLLGMDVFTKKHMQGAGLDFNIENVLRFIRKKGLNVLATVQPFDLGEGDAAMKGTGVTFLGLYARDKNLFGAAGQVKKAFVTGYWLLPDMIKECEKAGIEIFTIDGASEILPIAGSTHEAAKKGWPCRYNNLHLYQGPHYTLVVNKDHARKDSIMPVENEGDRGIVLHTTIGRGNGTLYFNYQIGDFATVGPVSFGRACPCGRTTPIMADVQRQDRPLSEVLGAGCSSDV